MIGLDDLKYFKKLAQTQNMRRAAEELSITQPSLSHCLKKLENELEVQLVIRSQKGIKLTNAGTQFLAKSELIIENWSELKSSFTMQKNKVSGLVKIGCHPSVAIYSLPKTLASVMKKHPDLEVQLMHGLSREITRFVLNSEVDVAISINPIEHPDLIIQNLGTDKVTLWQKSGNKNKDVLIVQPELAQSQWLMRELKRKKINFNRQLESTNLEVIANLTKSGAGVGILPSRVAKQYSLQSYKNAPSFDDEICLIYLPTLKQRASGRLIVEVLKDCLSKT